MDENTNEVHDVPMVALTKSEIKRLIDLIAESQIQGKEVLFIANILSKLVALLQEVKE